MKLGLYSKDKHLKENSITISWFNWQETTNPPTEFSISPNFFVSLLDGRSKNERAKISLIYIGWFSQKATSDLIPRAQNVAHPNKKTVFER